MTTTLSNFPAIAALPAPFDQDRAGRTIASLNEMPCCALLAADADFMRLVAHVAGASPYLARLMTRDVETLAAIHVQGAGALADDAETDAGLAGRAANIDGLHEVLRRAKRKAALAIALGDVGGAFDLAAVTGRLSRLAEIALSAAIRFHLRMAHEAGRVTLADPADPEAESGLIVLAMGKFGAFELNYSSDIDFVVFFEHDRMARAANVEAAPFFVKLTQDVVRAIQTVTVDGYVFRCDLRLRPDPGATQVAISAEAAEVYYESMGQSWERAAFIKARAVAGDRKAGDLFLHMLSPFVFRRHLDYAAIDDMRAMKRQIHAARGHATIAVEGHDIKLGRGGIREIEFYVQTQQLVMGGREPRLRGRATLAMLDELVSLGRVTAPARDELAAAYRFFRLVEHRVQMTDDEQSHRLPETAQGVAMIANFSGFADADAFRRDLLDHLTRVEARFDTLFAAGAPAPGEKPSIGFAAPGEAERMPAALAELGFRRAEDMAAVVNAWGAGRVRATRSPRAREKLSAILPGLLAAIARAPDADQALLRFDRFIEGLPSGVQLFALFQANPKLLALVVEVLSAAPRIASHLSQRPGVIDAMLDPAFFASLPDDVEVANQFRYQAGEAKGLEAVLDAARRIANEQRFRIGLQLVRGNAKPVHAGRAYAELASALVAGLLVHVRADIARLHGEVPGSAAAIVAFGKCGAREMTDASDLDLMFVYEFDDEVMQSDGARPIPPSQYFARVSQRMIAALTALTREGRLYDVDMRLRPSGNKGPVATRLASFVAYQKDEAWTWERMALTKARVIAGDPAFVTQVESAIRTALTQRIEPATIRHDARAMRRRMKAERPAIDRFDVKITDGGQVDLEFIAQALMLIHAPDRPDILAHDARHAFASLAAAGLMDARDATDLVAAADLYEAVSQIARVALEGRADSEEAIRAIEPLVLRATGMVDFDTLAAAFDSAQRRVSALFTTWLGA